MWASKTRNYNAIKNGEKYLKTRLKGGQLAPQKPTSPQINN